MPRHEPAEDEGEEREGREKREEREGWRRREENHDGDSVAGMLDQVFSAT